MFMTNETKREIAHDEALRFLRDAVEAIDQAHAQMKDAGYGGTRELNDVIRAQAAIEKLICTLESEIA